MQLLLKTILNYVEKHKSFVYKESMLMTDDQDGIVPRIVAWIAPRGNGRPICSGCDEVRPGYDKLPEREFEYVPLWGIPVFLVYALRRVSCPKCGVKVERVPWADGKSHLTHSYTVAARSI